jgi:phenylpyruvate tautomerase PptA (4-oxalocrotonate tautomerase family)
MRRLSVQVQEDHLASLVRSPIEGLTELIWNALDADADNVTVVYERNAADGIDAVRVEDDGHGMTEEDIVASFDRLGGSWKLHADRSKTKARSLHGKRGMGRYRSLGIGGVQTVWDTVADVEGQRLRSRIVIRRESLRDAEVSGPEPTDLATGTTARVEGITDNPPGLLAAETHNRLTARFALHLLKYPTVRIRVNGRELDAEQLVESVTDVPLDLPDAELTIIEWKQKVGDNNYLYLCDREGVSLHEIPAAVPSQGMPYSAYIKSQLIREMEDQLLLTAFEPEGISQLVSAARTGIKSHFDMRAAERARNVIQEWRDEDVYPFDEEPVSQVETVKRQLFDVVAYTAAPAVNAAKDPRSKRLSLALLERALESEPAQLRRILEEVLKLPKEQVEQLDQLLRHTTLTAIVTASRRIADRLEFLRGLEYLLFDPKMKDALKERSQLHKMVRNETWIFGEEFALAVDDKSLREVLIRHLKYLDDDTTPSDQPVYDSDGKVRIVDLMFSGSMEQARKRREHLVVELKRPSVKVGSAEIVQIEKYAFAVADDQRFNTTDVQWDFWVVSDELDPYAKQRANTDGLPPGMIHKGRSDSVRIWAVQWGDLIEDARHRLKFVQEQLNYLVTDEGAIDYLRRAHEQFLPFEDNRADDNVA